LTLTFSLPSTPTAIRAGFQIEAIDATTNDPYGTLSAGSDSRDAFNTVGVLTHDGAKNFTVNGANKTVSWTFDWTAPATGTNNVQFFYVVNATNGDNSNSGDNVYSDSKTVSGPSSGASVQLRAKVFLNNMTSYIITEPNFPTSDPYQVANAFNGAFTPVGNPTAATTSSTVLTSNSIVDWMFLELRSGASGSTNVVQTRAALIQDDGDMVAADGVSPVSFSVPSGNYYIAVRHRNHLGFRTNSPIALSSTPTIIDFTNNSVTLYGSSPLLAIAANTYAMIGGDSNSDGSIDAFDTILWEGQNGLFDDYANNADYNLDGSVDAFDSIIWELNNGKFQELD
jgi:hypothetical protein